MDGPVILEISTNIWSQDVTCMPIVKMTHEEFNRRGYKSHFIIPREGNTHTEQHGVHIWRFWVPFFEHYPERYGKGLWWVLSRLQWFMFQFLGTLKMARLAKVLKPDILYGHGPYGIPVASFVAKLRGIPNISRTYGFVFASEYTRLQHLMNFELPLSLMSPATAYVIGDDGTGVTELAERFGVELERAHFWIDGHDKEMCEEGLPIDGLRRSLGISKSDKVIVTVSSLTKYKGIRYVIEAIPKILKRFGDLKYLIVGEGPERENLRTLTAQLEVQDHVVFVGPVPHEDVGKYLSVADVVPCLWSIGPIFEAMICGKCPIVLDIMGMRRFVEDGKTGILLDPQKLGDLGDVIIGILENDVLRQNIGENAREWALQNLESVQERVEKEADLVLSIVQKKE
jgi:glycosyltransferase involved in cell wall biosynthesis